MSDTSATSAWTLSEVISVPFSSSARFLIISSIAPRFASLMSFRDGLSPAYFILNLCFFESSLRSLSSLNPRNPVSFPWFAWFSSSERIARWIISSDNFNFFALICSLIVWLIIALVSGISLFNLAIFFHLINEVFHSF